MRSVPPDLMSRENAGDVFRYRLHLFASTHPQTFIFLRKNTDFYALAVKAQHLPFSRPAENAG